MKGFADYLEKLITPRRPTMICGDFNMDKREVNDFTRMLSGKQFRQIVQKPTTYRGNCIDHFYHNISESAKVINYKMHYPYYSDHGGLCVAINNA